MNQYEISVQEFEDNMEFCVDLCARERIVWKIRRESGEYVMCVPVTERAAPVEPDILSMVDEFKQSFMEQNAT
jgi:hypothetical protein